VERGRLSNPDRRRPVYDFLQGLSKSGKPRIYAVLAMLEEHGNRLLMPHSRSLGEGLHEIRVSHAEGPFRIIYCFRPGRRIVLLHGFVKRTEQTPKADLDMARARKKALDKEE
jgi:phage-related protein